MTQIDRINGLIGSIAVKAPCRVATTANIALSGEQTIDDVSVIAEDRILVKNQTIISENGIYDCSATSWIRATDFNGTRDFTKGTLVRAIEGTANANINFEVISLGTTVDVSSIVFNGEIITSDVTYYANIAALRAITTAPSITNATTKGYTIDGDGGGGDFYWGSTSTDTDNGGTILKAAAITTGRWIRLYSDVINVKWFGAKGDNSTDDTAAIQAAIDYAEGTSVTDPSNNVYFPLGAYLIGSNISFKDCGLIGAQANSMVRLIWDGSAGGTMFTKPTGTWGGASFGLVYGIEFVAGTNEPETFFDLTANLIDKLFQFQRVQFNGCSGDAIKIENWINLHWSNLRWDNIGGYAIRCTPPTTQNLSSFAIDKFTYDHNRSSGAASGMIMVDNSADATNLGTFDLINGRIEINTAWTGNQAIVNYKLLNSPTASKALGLELDNVTYADATAMASDCVLYRETTNTVGRETLILQNVRLGNMSTILGGTWPSNQHLPSVPSTQVGFMAINAGDFLSTESGYICKPKTESGVGFEIGVGAESYPRFQQIGNGKMSWGHGAGVPDTAFARQGVGSLRCSTGKLLADGGIGVGNSVAATTLGNVIAKREVFDETGASIGFEAIYDAIT